jgi:hypothetical protein
MSHMRGPHDHWAWNFLAAEVVHREEGLRRSAGAAHRVRPHGRGHSFLLWRRTRGAMPQQSPCHAA